MILKIVFLVVLVHIATAQVGNFPGSSDEVTSLPEVNFRLHFRHYSGYLESTNKSQVHYWFFESQGNPSKDPVVLWLTGGPGCSSLLATMTEQGPIQMQTNGSLTPNPSTWNLNTNFLYLESPSGVGWSYNADKQYKTDDRQTAELNFEALKSFFKKFPHLKQNDFYITGLLINLFISFLTEIFNKQENRMVAFTYQLYLKSA